MVNKLLFSLLLQLGKIMDEKGFKTVQKKLPIMVDNLLKTDGYAIYLGRENQSDFYLDKERSFLKQNYFCDSWQEYNLPLSSCAEYIDDLDYKGPHYDWSFKKILKIPLHYEKTILGVVLIAWKHSCSLTNLSQVDVQLLQLLSQFLSNIYCVYPLVGELKERERDLIALYLKAEENLEDSRKQVSLELHDEVGQVLTSILLQLKLLQKSDDLDYVKGRLGGLHHITLETLEEVRRISQNLRPNLLGKLGLEAAIEAHIKDYVENTGIQVELRTLNLEERVAEGLENVLYRGVQEGLTNIARHSGADKVIISLTIKNNNIFLQIIDNGSGMKKNVSYGTGLLGMKERVTRASGKFWLVNKEEEGLSINILLPLTGGVS